MYNVNCCRNASVSEKGPLPRYTKSDEVKEICIKGIINWNIRNFKQCKIRVLVTKIVNKLFFNTKI